MPTLSLALTQLVLSAADWTLAGAVLYVLLPPVPFHFWHFWVRSWRPSCSAWRVTFPAGSACSKD